MPEPTLHTSTVVQVGEATHESEHEGCPCRQQDVSNEASANILPKRKTFRRPPRAPIYIVAGGIGVRKASLARRPVKNPGDFRGMLNILTNSGVLLNGSSANGLLETPDVSSRTHVVLPGQPTGWTAMAQAVRNFDEEKVKDCKEDVDTLLVFVSF